MIHSGRRPKAVTETAQKTEPCRAARLVLLLGSIVLSAFVVTSAGTKRIPDNAHFAGAYPVFASTDESGVSEDQREMRGASGREMGIWDYIESIFAKFLTGDE